MRNVVARMRRGTIVRIPVRTRVEWDAVARAMIAGGAIVQNRPERMGYEELDMFLHEKYVMP